MFCPHSSGVPEPTRKHAFEPRGCQPNEEANKWTRLCLGRRLAHSFLLSCPTAICFDPRSSIHLCSVAADVDVPRRCNNSGEKTHLCNEAFRQGGAKHKKEHYLQHRAIQSISSQSQLTWRADVLRWRSKILLASKTCTRNATCMFNV